MSGSASAGLSRKAPTLAVAITEARDALHLVAWPSGDWEPFAMRLNSPEYDDVRVRQAIRPLVDRQQIVDRAFSGVVDIGNDDDGIYDVAHHEDLQQREQDVEPAKSSGRVGTARLPRQQAQGVGIDFEVKKRPVSAHHKMDDAMRVELIHAQQTAEYHNQFFWSNQ